MKTLETILSGLELNPAVKHEDIIYIAKSPGYPHFEGTISKVYMAGKTAASKDAFNMKVDSPFIVAPTQILPLGCLNYNINDRFYLLTRELEAFLIKKRIEDTKIILRKEEERYDFLSKYKSEEEYLAYKLKALFDLGVQKDNPKDAIASMTEILKELKSTNLL